jgi:ABC-type amino acid transport substrate-binding protein
VLLQAVTLHYDRNINMIFLSMVLSHLSEFELGFNSATLVLFSTSVVVGAGLYALYRFFTRPRLFTPLRGRLFTPARKELRIGVVTSLINEAITPEIEQAFQGYMRESMEVLGSRLGAAVSIKELAPYSVERALSEGSLDIVVVDGNSALTFSSQIELMPYHISSLNALALVFWDKIPHHMLTLADYANYPLNTTAVLKNSLEENYLAIFEKIKMRRVDTLTRLVVDLKLGLVRAGLVRMEQAKAIKMEYPAIKFMPVSLTNQCFVQDERLAMSRANKDFIKEVEQKISVLRREGVLKKIHSRWFMGLRPQFEQTLPAVPRVQAPVEEQKNGSTSER